MASVRSQLDSAQGLVNQIQPVLDIAELSFSWKRSLSPVIKIDSFVVNKGELLFLQGASGSGKSTLLSLITGILKPQEGSIKVMGTNIARLSGGNRDTFRSDNIGYVFQMFNLIPYLSVIENILLPCKFSQARTKKVLEQSSSLEGEARRLLAHLNLDTPELINKPVVELSVGQQQRVAAARALIGKPGLIVADEPTSSLDAAHRESFLKLLFDECSASGATLLFVSHDAALGSLFNRVVDFAELNIAGRYRK